jgi:hypothetical protein
MKVSKGRRKKFRRKKFKRGHGATLLDLCFAVNMRKTMEAIRSGLECLEESGKVLHAGMGVSAARVEGAKDGIGGAEMRAMSNEQ